MVLTFLDIFFIFSTQKPIFLHMDAIENPLKPTYVFHVIS